MTDHERGAYSPQTDAPLAFDARRSQGGGGGFPTTLAISLVILAVLIVAIVLFYRSGVRGAGEGPLAVGTPVGQMKAPAPNNGAQSDQATGLQIYKTETAPSEPPPPPAFAAGPEQPQARPTTPVAAQPLPGAGSPPPPPPRVVSPAASPAQVAASGATSPAAKAVPAPAKAAPRDEIAELLTRTPPAARSAAAPAQAAPAAAGAATVQIGAYSSQDLASRGWSDLAKAFPADMSGKGQHYEPVARDGKMLYRAAVTGFASHDAAVAFCAKLKAAGRACIVK